MLSVRFARIRPEKEARLRAWLAELGERRSEVLESFEQETTRHEQVFILRGDSGPVLVYVMEAQDMDRAAATYRESTLSIDKEHRAVLQECLLEHLKIEPLFDCALQSRSIDEAP